MSAVKNFFMYFLRSMPETEFRYYIPLTILVILLIITAIVVSIIYNKKKKTDFAFKRLFKNMSKRLVLIAVLFTIYMLIRYESIPYFSMRLWLYLIATLFLFFTYRYVKAYKIEYPKEKSNFEFSHPAKKTGNKYLPNKK